MEAYLTELWQTVAGHVPRLVMAMLALVVGWIVALIGAAIARGILKRTSLDNKAAAFVSGGEKKDGPAVEATGGKLVFWIIMAFALVAFFSILGLHDVATPLSSFLDKIFEFLPRLLSAGVLLAIAWLVARGLRFAVSKGLGATGLDTRVAPELPDGATPPSQTLSEIAYWLTFLVFLPAILGALGLEGLLAPVNELLGEVMAFLPNLFAAGLILGVGLLVARVVQRIVSSALAAAGADSLGDRVGLGKVFGEGQLSKLVGLIVYILIFVPMVVAALEALGLESLTAPASAMLEQIVSTIPQIFGAAIILAIAYMIARLVADLVERLLEGVGFDGFLGKIGFQGAGGEGGRSPSQLVSWIAMAAIMLFATIEALEMLGFVLLATIVTEFTFFAADVLLAVVILAIGLYFANLAADAVRSSGTRNAATLATGARIAITVLATAMALRQAGVAEDIINMAFGLTLGAAAVAAAIAFGMGGRDFAARQLARWTGGGSGGSDSMS